jgi:hypothetical protein
VLGAIFTAYTKGYMSHCSKIGKPANPYKAFVYMVKTLETAVLNGIPMVTEAPLWFRILYDAVRPKEARFRNTVVRYKFSGDEFYGVTPSWNYSVSDGGHFTMLVPDADDRTVNGLCVLVSPGNYVDADGKDAFADLCSIFGDPDLKKIHPMWRIGNLNDPVWSSDASAFATCFPSFGKAADGINGELTELGNESYINRPLLSKFTAWGAPVARCSDNMTVTGGGAFYLGGRLIELPNEKAIKNKSRPIFKAIDFNEFVEVVIIWLGNLLQLQEESTMVNQDHLTPLKAPFTRQQIAILLRQAIVSAMGEAQFLGSDLTRELFLDGEVYQGSFVPLQVGAGIGPSEAALQMLLPVPIVENIRDLARRCAVSVDGKVAIDWVPVFGVYTNETLPTNYHYSFRSNNGTIVADVLQENPAEIAIDMIDGSFGANPLNLVYTGDPISWEGFVAFNGYEYTELLTRWNEYVMGFSATSVTLMAIGSEPGINALEVINMSYNYIQGAVPSVVPEEVSSPTTQRKTMTKKDSKVQLKKIGVSVAAGANMRSVLPVGGETEYRIVDSVTSNQKITTTGWETQQYWILPSYREQSVDKLTSSQSVYTTAKIEGNSQIISPVSSVEASAGVNRKDIVNLFDRHATYAALCSRQYAGSTTVLEKTLLEATQNGRGGFLADMIKGFAIPLASNLLDKLPF